jgi:hypothetical protein
MATVTLVNPSDLEPNPRRRRRRGRRRRNPLGFGRGSGDINRHVFNNFPSLISLLGGATGMVGAVFPTFLRNTRGWTSVGMSALVAVGGTALFSILRQRDLAQGFAAGAGGITLVRAALLLFPNSLSFDPSVPVNSRLGVGRRRRRRNPYPIEPTSYPMLDNGYSGSYSGGNTVASYGQPVAANRLSDDTQLRRIK